METVDDGIEGKYHKLARAGEQQNMDRSSYKKSLKLKEKKLLNQEVRSISNSNCSENARYHFQSFAENASIDGIKFVGEKGRTIPERIFWTITMIVALVLCIILVVQTFKKWINSPVIVTFATSQTPIFQIPFPAITICPEVKSNKLLFNYTDIFLKRSNNETMDEEEKSAFNYMSLICGTPAELLDEDAILTNHSVIDYFNWVSFDIDTYTLTVEWKGHDFDDDNTTEPFSTIITGAGICYTFNAFDRKELFTDIVSYQKEFFSTDKSSEWFPEKGYLDSAGIDAYPRRTMVAGVKGGLSLVLTVNGNNLDYACGDSLQGFKVSLHHPGELPRINQNYFQLPLDQIITAAVKPNMMTTSDDLRTYKPKDRQCYFLSEKYLKFFKIYNQQNCLTECLANFTLKYCDCVSFHMPKEMSTPICGAASMECMDNAKVLFLEDEVNYKIKESRRAKLKRKILDDTDYSDKCDCLPACTSLDYDIEISQSNWNWQDTYNVLRQTKNWDKDLDQILANNSIHLTALQIFFKEMQFITSERNELYGYADFWANIGGIIGLFTGFSFITMFEIFYYLSLRLYCNVRLFGQQNWSGASELLEESKSVSEINKSV